MSSYNKNKYLKSKGTHLEAIPGVKKLKWTRHGEMLRGTGIAITWCSGMRKICHTER